MKYRIFLISDAEKDIMEIYDYVSKNDSITKAENLLKELEQKCNSLSQLPDRGHTPPELERIGIQEYQEIHYGHYRIIYQVIESSIFIHCILDGRRNLQEIVTKRILR